MDGFDRLVEMLEERFGRWFANALLVLVCLGAASLAMNLFVVDFVIPLWKIGFQIIQYFEGSTKPITKDDLLHVVLTGAASLGAAVIFSLVGMLIFRIWFGRVEKRLRGIITQIDGTSTNAIAEVKRTFAPFHEFIREAQAAGVKVPHELLSHEDEGLSSQSPPDISEDKWR